MEKTMMDAFKQATKELAAELGQDEELAWKLMKKIIYMYITRV